MSTPDRLAQIRARAEAATAPLHDPDVRDYFHGRPGLPDADSADDLIQAGANQAAERVRAVESVIPALLAAVEAVLAMHEPGDCYQCGDPTCRNARCSECRTTAPCDTVRAITEALA